ncbi:MAG TPA: WbqC family protein [Flavobacteriaceae bacterium]|nr:WbqC family protein [Flavobacteriaceae bacterium]MCB9212442.1 WbqC family protein [Alteromonas sp.]HPF11718.1 WbqC family protein [Flavobacteriaceae bacterium]HQU20193.1 WbqC family protein [Flavobacteriaceae bacterium]HQU64718.1 WbqC family protein [Flavobacteriaceae bacterium]
MVLVHPTYFPNVSLMAATAQAEGVVFEIADNYQKQTYRNRAYVAHAQGRLSLNVPVKHSKTGERQKTKEVLVENHFPWLAQHWKSLQTAYRASPFFEFYEDDLLPLFERRVESLLDHNLQIYEVLCELIGMDPSYGLTEEYLKNPLPTDLRFLVEAKGSPPIVFGPYSQVLESHHGFLSNLSILDVLFNLGPETLAYLETQKLPW